MTTQNDQNLEQQLAKLLQEDERLVKLPLTPHNGARRAFILANIALVNGLLDSMPKSKEKGAPVAAGTPDCTS